MELLLQSAFALVVGLVVSVVTSIITVRLSLKRFYSEKWWQRKAEAYSKILEELYKLRIEASGFLDHFESTGKFSSRSVSTAEVERAVAIGAFEVSEKAVEILQAFLRDKRTANKDHPYEYFGDLLVATKEAIDSVRECALKDLNVL